MLNNSDENYTFAYIDLFSGITIILIIIISVFMFVFYEVISNYQNPTFSVENIALENQTLKDRLDSLFQRHIH